MDVGLDIDGILVLLVLLVFDVGLDIVLLGVIIDAVSYTHLTLPTN